MKLFFMMSWRNLWRHKRRSLVVISSIGIGIFAMIFSIGLMNGFNIQMVENTINTSLGHIAIHQKGFQDNIKLEYNFIPGDKVIKALAERRDIRAYAPRVKIQGMIRSSESSRGVLIIGIEPGAEKKVTSMYEYTIRTGGSEFLASDSADDILISKTMAEILDVGVGDKVVLMIQDMDNDIVGVGMRVVGLYQSPADGFDKFMVFVGIKKIQEITGMGDSISELTIITKNKDIVESVARQLAARIADPGLEILTWKDMAPNLVSAIKLYDSMIFVFFLIIFITVVFSVANTLIMAIMERFHEIGVMKCIGTSPMNIFSLIIFEALNLGAVGLVAGLAVGLLVVGVLAMTGIDFSVFSASMRMWGSGSIIYPTVRFLDIGKSAMVVFITTIIAALYPAIKAARIKPLDALHYV